MNTHKKTLRKRLENKKKYSQTGIKNSWDEFLSLKKSVVNEENEQKKALRKRLENNKKYSQTSIKLV